MIIKCFLGMKTIFYISEGCSTIPAILESRPIDEIHVYSVHRSFFKFKLPEFQFQTSSTSSKQNYECYIA